MDLCRVLLSLGGLDLSQIGVAAAPILAGIVMLSKLHRLRRDPILKSQAVNASWF